MEAINIQSKSHSGKGALWTGRIISGIITLFLLVDALMKVVESKVAMDGSGQLGWPEQAVQAIGIVLLLATILYVIPRTSILGAIILTGYLGGAASVMVRAMQPGHPYLFPVVFGVLVWAGLFLRDEKIRALIPLRKENI